MPKRSRTDAFVGESQANEPRSTRKRTHVSYVEDSEDSDNPNVSPDDLITKHPLRVGDPIKAKDYQGNWLAAQVAGVENKGKLRIKIDDKALVRGRRKVATDPKRKYSTPVKAAANRQAGYGDWVRVHFKGFNSNQDEWILYQHAGHICVDVLDQPSACGCERHHSRYLSTLPSSLVGDTALDKHDSDSSVIPESDDDEDDDNNDDGDNNNDDDENENNDKAPNGNAATSTTNRQPMDDLYDEDDDLPIAKMGLPKTRSTDQELVDSINQLIVDLGVTFSQICRYAGIEASCSAARYWLKRQNLHQPSVKQAGAALAKWYDEKYPQNGTHNKRRTPPVTPATRKPTSQRPPPSGSSTNGNAFETPARGSRTRAASSSSVKKEGIAPPSTSKRPSRRRAGTGLSTLLGEGVSLNETSNLWDAHVSLCPESTHQLLLGSFTTSEDAKHVCEGARRSLALQHKTLVGSCANEAGSCRWCHGTKAGEVQQCPLCGGGFHAPCEQKQQDPNDEQEKVASSLCFSCFTPLFLLTRPWTKAAQATTNVKQTPGAGDGGGAPKTRTRSHTMATDSGSVVKEEAHQSPARGSRDRSDSLGRSRQVRFGRSSRGQTPGSRSTRSRGSNSQQPKGGSSAAATPQQKGDDGTQPTPATEWIGHGYKLDAMYWNHQKVQYCAFKFVANDTVYRILDHVVLERIHDEEQSQDDGTGGANGLDYYVGQIESLWEEPDGSKKVRIAWFFWPEETDMATPAQSLANEVYTSCEVDINPLGAIVGKIQIVPYSEYQELENGKPDTWNRYPSSRTWDSETKQRVQARELNPVEGWHLFVRHHYHHRASMLVGVDYPARQKLDGRDPWIAPFLCCTPEEPDLVQSILTEEDKTHVTPISMAIADIQVMDATIDAMGPEDSSRGIEKCGFCSYSLIDKPGVECVVCPGLGICLDCFGWGRQGQVTCVREEDCSKADDQTHPEEGKGDHRPRRSTRGQPVQGQLEQALELTHKSHHPYRVCVPRTRTSDPRGAEAALGKLCREFGMVPPTYTLVDVCRGPLPRREVRAPCVRYKYGVRIQPLVSNQRKSSKARKFSGCVIGTTYGKTIQEAKDLGALEVLRVYFGSGSTMDRPMFDGDWSMWETIRLIDAIQLQGLAWEFVAGIVGTKNPRQCREFFTQQLLPSWGAAVNWVPRKPDPKQYELGGLKITGELQAVATDHVRNWTRRIREMHERRKAKYCDDVDPRRPGDKLYGVVDHGKRRELLFVFLGGHMVQLPGRVTAESDSLMNVLSRGEASGLPDFCRVCCNGEGQGELITCESCGDKYHLKCVTPALEEMQAEWICNLCAEDYNYVQDHVALGATGLVLCELAEAEGRKTTREMVSEYQALWKINDSLIERVTKKAASFTGTSSKRQTSAQSAPSSEARRRRKKRESIEASTDVKPNARASSQDTGSRGGTQSARKSGNRVERLPGADLDDRLAWETRHFLHTTVAGLESKVSGLEEGLNQVTRQRDALLKLLLMKGHRVSDLQYYLDSESCYVPAEMQVQEFKEAEE